MFACRQVWSRLFLQLMQQCTHVHKYFASPPKESEAVKAHPAAGRVIVSPLMQHHFRMHSDPRTFPLGKSAFKELKCNCPAARHPSARWQIKGEKYIENRKNQMNKCLQAKGALSEDKLFLAICSSFLGFF